MSLASLTKNLVSAGILTQSEKPASLIGRRFICMYDNEHRCWIGKIEAITASDEGFILRVFRFGNFRAIKWLKDTPNLSIVYSVGGTRPLDSFTLID